MLCAALAGAALSWLLATAVVADEVGGGAPLRVADLMRVLHPQVECSSELLEVEIYDREREDWVSHAQHSRIYADTCQTEDASILLNEIRTRCAEPPSSDNWSPWRVGIDLWDADSMSRCSSQVPGRRESFDLEIEIVSPRPGQVVESANLETQLKGRVRVEGRALGPWDVLFLLDAAPGPRRLDDEGRAPMFEAIEALRSWVADRREDEAFHFGLVAFSEEPKGSPPSETRLELDTRLQGDDTQLLATLASFVAAPLHQAPRFADALELALSEFAARGRSDAARAIVVLYDGRAELPFGDGAGVDPAFRRRMTAAAAPAREGRLLVHGIALGGAGDAAELVDSMFEDTASLWWRVPSRLASARGLEELPFPTLESVSVTSTSAGEPAREVTWDREGRFEARVRLHDGVNTLRIQALDSTGASVDASLRLTLDNRRLREVLLEREREVMRRVRRGKRVIIEAEEP